MKGDGCKGDPWPFTVGKIIDASCSETRTARSAGQRLTH